MRTQRIVFALLLAGAGPGVLLADGVPVPATMKNGKTLILTEPALSVDAPSIAYKWTSSKVAAVEGESAGGTVYFAQNTMNDHELPYMVFIAQGKGSESKISSIGTSDVDRFVQGLKRGASQASGLALGLSGRLSLVGARLMTTLFLIEI